MQNRISRTSLYIWLAFIGISLAGRDRAPLEQKLVSSDATIREKAIEKLVGFPSGKKKSFAPKLTAYLKSEDTLIASRATNAFVAIGEPAVETLASLVADSDIFVRLNAITALGDIGPAAKSAAPAITTALKDPHPLIREEATYALKKIGEQSKPTSPSPARS